MAQVDPDPCALCIQGKGGGQKCDPCLKELEEKDFNFLSGHQEPVTIWKADGDILPKLCKRIRSGDDIALSMGFRLAVVLDEESNQDVIEALCDSIMKNPTGFLEQLQITIDFCKKENEVGPLKECYWNAFINNDFGCGNQPEQELKAVRQRKETVQKIRNPRIKEAQRFILELFNEKIIRLNAGT